MRRLQKIHRELYQGIKGVWSVISSQREGGTVAIDREEVNENGENAGSGEKCFARRKLLNSVPIGRRGDKIRRYRVTSATSNRVNSDGKGNGGGTDLVRCVGKIREFEGADDQNSLTLEKMMTGL